MLLQLLAQGGVRARLQLIEMRIVGVDLQLLVHELECVGRLPVLQQRRRIIEDQRAVTGMRDCSALR